MNSFMGTINYNLITGDENLRYLLGYEENDGGICIECKCKHEIDECRKRLCNKLKLPYSTQIEEIQKEITNLMSRVQKTKVAESEKIIEELKSKFCQSTCGFNIMIEGYSGTGKTILATQLCCRTINVISKKRDVKTPFILFYSLDQSSSEILRMITSFDFLKKNEIEILNKDHSLFNILEKYTKPNERSKRRKLFIRELRNLENLNQLLGQLHEDFSIINDDVMGNIDKNEIQTSENYPVIIVIDSINTILRKHEGFRSELKEILDFPKWNDKCCTFNLPISKILTFEKGSEIDRTEEYLCDCVIELKKINRTRILDILKIRDQPSYLGGNVFDIKSKEEKPTSGIVIYPSLESCNKIYETKKWKEEHEKDERNLKEKRASFGIKELDDALEADSVTEKTDREHGINYGSSLLIKGDPGCYKTELAMKFLREGYRKPKRENCIFISFRMSKDAFETIHLFDDNERQGEKTEKRRFLDNDLIFIPGFDTPFQTASQFMYKIRDNINKKQGKTKKPVRRAVFFGIDILNCYPSFKDELLEFFQVLLEYFRKNFISCVFIDWSKSVAESELTKLARNLIPNQIEIENKDEFKLVRLLRKEHRFSTKYIPGKLVLKNDHKEIIFDKLTNPNDIKGLQKLFQSDKEKEKLTINDLMELFNIDDFYKNEFLKYFDKNVELKEKDTMEMAEIENFVINHQKKYD